MKTTLLISAIALSLFSCQEKGSDSPESSTAAAKPYPLDVCIVSGEQLGSMGEAVVYVHEGQEVSQ